MSDSPTVVDSALVWPDDAMDVEEAVVSNWFVREGAHADEGDTICEIQIEKVSIDVSMPVTGVVEERLVGESDVFARGDPLARVRPD
ncbi:lipoyl domain-containing protein [Halomarina oriensis]|uniref:Biotin attachment protein n=1 Tax=Halomarina oriensis TaxID=671145 RepID=A0A6B0GVT6_9EURY|nr:lipoyl domain-containing protein [Halomarina oriensis]MWG36693.1 biotin attachment protein [Halomarina oriensis]